MKKFRNARPPNPKNRFAGFAGCTCFAAFSGFFLIAFFS